MIVDSAPSRTDARVAPARTGAVRTEPQARRDVSEPTGDRGERARSRWVLRWALLVGAAFALGAVLRLAGVLPHDPLAPLHAHARLPTVSLLPAVGLAATLVAVLPVAARRLDWRPLLVTGWSAAFCWAVVLAGSTGGLDALGRPLTHPTEYLRAVPTVGQDPLGWLAGFTAHLDGYPTHVKGHPPLPVLLLWTLDRVGLGGQHGAGVFVVAVGSSAVAAVSITLRAVAGQTAARRALPFLVLAPYAVWVATSMDALFLGVGAWATALIAIAVGAARTGAVGAALGIGWAFAGGILLGALPYLSYGLLPLFAVPVAVARLRRAPLSRWLAAGAGATTVVVLITAAGFWWPDGVAATAQAWATHAGGLDRPYWYFAVSNLAVLALVVGPATARVIPDAARDVAAAVAGCSVPVAGRGRLAGIRETAAGATALVARAVAGRHAVVFVAVVALAGALSLDLAGVTRGEVERIWLPYAVWVAAVNAYHRPPARGALAAQAAVGLTLQAFVGSIW